MFGITGSKGFHMTFGNGWTISVQFGPGNYCMNYGLRSYERLMRGLESVDAEIAIWDRDGNWFKFPSGDEVLGYVTPDFLARIIHTLAFSPETLPALIEDN